MATLNINYSYAGETPGSEFDSERSDYGDGEAEDIEEVEEEYADPEEEYFISVSEETEEGLWKNSNSVEDINTSDLSRKTNVSIGGATLE